MTQEEFKQYSELHEKFAKDVDKTFRDKLLTTLKNYDFTKASDRKGFCNYVYQIDLAGKGMKVF